MVYMVSAPPLLLHHRRRLPDDPDGVRRRFASGVACLETRSKGSGSGNWFGAAAMRQGAKSGYKRADKKNSFREKDHGSTLLGRGLDPTPRTRRPACMPRGAAHCGRSIGPSWFRPWLRFRTGRIVHVFFCCSNFGNGRREVAGWQFFFSSESARARRDFLDGASLGRALGSVHAPCPDEHAAHACFHTPHTPSCIMHTTSLHTIVGLVPSNATKAPTAATWNGPRAQTCAPKPASGSSTNRNSCNMCESCNICNICNTCN
jgi:hypothetical protein